MNQQVKIAKGNPKTGAKVLNVSKRPGTDCGNCKSCFDDCYARKAFKQYPATKAAWTHNGELFRKDSAAAVKSVGDQLKAKRTLPKYFRIDVSGDLIDQQEFDAWKQLAIELPTVKFLAFTKMYWVPGKRKAIVFNDIPDNFSVVASIWSGMSDKQIAAAGDLPKAWVNDGKETRIPDTAIDCPGHCESCGMCWNLKTIQRDVYFDIH